jgi:hypothetical protein
VGDWDRGREGKRLHQGGRERGEGRETEEGI